MEQFDCGGHLTDEVLLCLIQETPMDELERLEIAEHLAYCDLCLQRYTELLADAPLLIPDRSCQDTLWQKLRRRAIRMVTSRYATAAAAVALALTMLWSSTALPNQNAERHDLLQEVGSTVTERVRSFPSRWNDSLSGVFSDINRFFDTIGGSRPQTNQGGTHS